MKRHSFSCSGGVMLNSAFSLTSQHLQRWCLCLQVYPTPRTLYLLPYHSCPPTVYLPNSNSLKSFKKSIRWCYFSSLPQRVQSKVLTLICKAPNDLALSFQTYILPLFSPTLRTQGSMLFLKWYGYILQKGFDTQCCLCFLPYFY